MVLCAHSEVKLIELGENKYLGPHPQIFGVRWSGVRDQVWLFKKKLKHCNMQPGLRTIDLVQSPQSENKLKPEN